MIKSMQGTPYQVVEGWKLKEKDEFEWETRTIKKKSVTSKPRENKCKNIRGYFTLKFNGEEPIKYTIGENISKDAKIINNVCSANPGDSIHINGEKAILLEKNVCNKI